RDFEGGSEMTFGLGVVALLVCCHPCRASIRPSFASSKGGWSNPERSPQEDSEPPSRAVHGRLPRIANATSGPAVRTLYRRSQLGCDSNHLPAESLRPTPQKMRFPIGGLGPSSNLPPAERPSGTNKRPNDAVSAIADVLRTCAWSIFAAVTAANAWLVWRLAA